jgi:hypothetical protein
MIPDDRNRRSAENPSRTRRPEPPYVKAITLSMHLKHASRTTIVLE